ncbi:uncharacterized protein METZ01_LOCUS405649, partial [marine metagenome]
VLTEFQEDPRRWRTLAFVVTATVFSL